MRRLREQGLISRYEDYLALPMPVIQHAHLLFEAEDAQRKREEAKAKHARERAQRGRR